MSPTTIKSNGGTRFFLCQYTRDPFRREARNVGVIVQSALGVASRFIGETDSQTGLDGRRLKDFGDADNYRNWVHFWKRTVSRHSTALYDRLLEANQDSYAVVDGGYVGDLRTESPTEIARSLFEMLVGDGSLDDALEIEVEPEKSSPLLANDVSREFRRLRITTSGECRAPIYRSRDLIGATRPHRFDFVQSNGSYAPMEVFEFRHGRKKSIDHHVGWAAHAFDDVVKANVKPTHPYAIVNPPDKDSEPSLKDCFDQAMKVLPNCSTVVRWDSLNERDQFLCQRQIVAMEGFSLLD